jgi:hypothetical protein
VGGLSGLHLVHGVMRAGVSAPASARPAVAGGALVAVGEGPLAALATRLPDVLTDGAAAADLFSDVERTRAVALAHHELLSAVAATGDIAPVRLGALRDGEASVRAMLAAESAHFSERLAAVAGMVELAVRLVTDADAPHQPAPAAATGRDYLRARSAVANAGRDHEALASLFAREAEQTFAVLAADTRPGGAAPAGQPKRWLDLALLVRREAVSEVAGLAESLGQKARRLRLVLSLTGPWPAYSFVAKEG